jgi:hypothetical protein
MQAMTSQLEEPLAEAGALSWHDARQEDAYWKRTFWQERYYRCEFDYEDYAPAYCVGYMGCSQYGGEFADAQASLCANWERIKGDSRLPLAEAMPAIRAGWEHVASLLRRRHLQSAQNDASFTRTDEHVAAAALEHVAPAALAAAAAN